MGKSSYLLQRMYLHVTKPEKEKNEHMTVEEKEKNRNDAQWEKMAIFRI